MGEEERTRRCRTRSRRRRGTRASHRACSPPRGRHTGWNTVPEVEEEEPERRGPSLKSIFELKTGFSSKVHLLPYRNRYCISTGTHLRVTRIRAYRASAHTQGPIGWEPQGVVPYDRAGPPGAIYSSNRGLLEHPPTVPREKRDWKAEKRKRKNTGADGQQASGP